MASNENDKDHAKRSKDREYELHPLLNGIDGKIDRSIIDSRISPCECPQDSGEGQVDEIDEIYPKDFRDTAGESSYHVNVPVRSANPEKELEANIPHEEESDNEEEDGFDVEGEEEPVGTFEDPRATEPWWRKTVDEVVRKPPTRLFKSAALRAKHKYLMNVIHYDRKEKMEAALNSENEINQVRLLTMKDPDQMGMNCLMKAVTRQSLQCINSLFCRFEALLPVFHANNFDKLEALRSKDGRNIFHLAAKILNGREIMDELELCQLKELIADLPDQNGETPLITACKSSNRLMAVRLVSYGAKIDHVDKDGFSPIYLMAVSGSAETLNFFLVHGSTLKKHNYSMTDGASTWGLLSNSRLYKKGGTILRAITEGVTTNTLETCFATNHKRKFIKKCLEVELSKNESFYHDICATSLVDLVKLVINYDKTMLDSVDSNGMTPLMRATEAGQFENVKMILDFQVGKDTVLRARPSDKKTTLMIACAGGHDEIARYIVASSDVLLKAVDSDGKNVFHYAVKHHKVLSVLIDVCSSKAGYENYKKLLQDRDNAGDIPLHIAAVIGSHKNVKLLLKNDVPYDMTSSRMERSSLHYAACANLDTVKVLVEFVRTNYDECKLQKFINAVDCKGQTCLHLAASLGHWKTVWYLLENGAEILGDHEMETPLHLAAACGCLKTTQQLLKVDKSIIHNENRVGETAAMFAAVMGKTEVLQLLLKNKAHLWARKNDLDNCRRTCLDWAVANRHPATACAILDHDGWKEAMKQSYHGADGLLAEMVRKMPNVALKVLDKCVTNEEEQKVYDFFPLQTVQEFRCPNTTKTCEKVTAMKALGNMADHSSDDCLGHTVVRKFLGEKWKKRARTWYLFDLFVYTIFLIALTTYIGLVRNDQKKRNIVPTTTNSTAKFIGKHPIPPDAPGAIVATVICVAFACIGIIKEIFQLLQRKHDYFLHFSIYMELAMYMCVFVFLFPLSHNKGHYQWQAGAVAIFLAWLNFIGFIKNFPTYGIYIIMAKKIFLTFLKVFIPLCFFVMAFAMTFFVLLRDEDATNMDENDGFSNIPRALVTSFAMMVGELDYRDTFLKNTRAPNFVLTLIFLVIFMILMTILLMNLLTGLAVGDTGEIMKRALTEKRIQQALLIVEMDKSLNKYPFLRADYIEPVRESPGKKATKTLRKLMGLFFPDLYMTKKEEKSSFEREYYDLRAKMDDITTQLEAIQKMLKENSENEFGFKTRVFRRRQGYSI